MMILKNSHDSIDWSNSLMILTVVAKANGLELVDWIEKWFGVN